jgi:hypothetical protein
VGQSFGIFFRLSTLVTRADVERFMPTLLRIFLLDWRHWEP